MLALEEALEKDNEKRPDIIPFLLLPLSVELLLLLLESLVRMASRHQALRDGVRRAWSKMPRC